MAQSRKWPRRGLHALGVTAAAFMAAACAAGDQYPQTTFRPVSEYGEILNPVFYNTTLWTMPMISATSSVGTVTSWMKSSMFSQVVRFSRFAFTQFSMPE